MSAGSPSITRTGTAWWASESAVASPTGPAPTMRTGSFMRARSRSCARILRARRRVKCGPMKRRHTVDDHALGREHGHSHDGADADHDHEHFDESLPLEENPIWIQDHVSLASVGIDIGSSGTQVIFSRVELRRFGEALTSRYRVVKRETLHASPIALTPYAADDRIDAARLGKASGFDWNRGDVPEGAGLDRVAESMADSLLKFDSFYLTEPIALENIDGVMFSGGVAEYVYGRESRDFGDLGRRLGHALKKRIDSGALPWPLLPPGECIRATALGASEYSVQLSGNTCYISDPGTLLPRRNLQVLHPDIDLSGNISSGAIEKAIRSHFTAFDLIEGEAEVALAFRWSGAPAYERIAALAAGLCLALRARLAKALPLYVVLDGDIAQTLGAILREERGVKNPLLVIDGIDLRDFDYIP